MATGATSSVHPPAAPSSELMCESSVMLTGFTKVVAKPGMGLELLSMAATMPGAPALYLAWNAYSGLMAACASKHAFGGHIGVGPIYSQRHPWTNQSHPMIINRCHGMGSVSGLHSKHLTPAVEVPTKELNPLLWA